MLRPGVLHLSGRNLTNEDRFLPLKGAHAPLVRRRAEARANGPLLVVVMIIRSATHTQGEAHPPTTTTPEEVRGRS